MTDNQETAEDTNLEEALAGGFEFEELLTLAPQQPNYGFSLVHDRVFVTWFDAKPVPDQEYQFVSEPMSIELTEEEANDFHGLLNAQMDQLQALLEGFVKNREGVPDCADPDTLIDA